jgi:hypothetical protein
MNQPRTMVKGLYFLIKAMKKTSTVRIVWQRSLVLEHYDLNSQLPLSAELKDHISSDNIHTQFWPYNYSRHAMLYWSPSDYSSTQEVNNV